eukprot:3905289-Pleurochrysis_carterae.AAC.1
MAPRGIAPDQSNTSVCHERAHDLHKLNLDHSTHRTTAHLLKGLHGPQSRSATPCTPRAKRPSGTLAAPSCLSVRIAKLFGSAAHVILNELTY